MKFWSSALALATIAPAILVSSSLVAQTADELVKKGSTIAAAHCARCHATGMNDASTHPKAPPFRLVVERYPSEHLAEAMAEGLNTGHLDMPVFVFEPADIDAFLAYLDSLTPPKASKP